VEPILMLILTFFGFLAGLVGGFLGIGGCVIMLPTLYFLLKYPLPLAIGTTITAVIVTALSGSIAHIRIRNVDYDTTLKIAISGSLGSILGSLIFLYLVEKIPILNLVLGFAFLYISLRMIYEGFLRRKAPEKTGKSIPGGVVKKSLIGFGIGVVTGIVGLGGGYALVPSFIYLLGAPVKIAVGTSLPSFISMAVISGGFKIYQGYVDITAALLLGIGTAIGAQVGARLVPKMPTWIIKAVFGLLFLYISLKFVFSAFNVQI